MRNKKNILILGSTGNLGKQVLDAIKSLKEYRVAGLTTNTNTEEILKQAKIFTPDFIVIADAKKAEGIKIKNCRLYKGEEWLGGCVKKEKINCVFNALQGPCGILPTITAIRERKKIFMANKESLVAAGDIIMREAKKYGVDILPVDSEHSAIFQCLAGECHNTIKKVILTCSGGYRKKKINPAIDDLLNNSRWKMGEKITVDSATLMNKGFEMIEARALFGFSPNKIDVVIHPEAVVHSMVEFCDGSIKAVLGPTSMRHPIIYALTYPERKKDFGGRLIFDNLPLNFQKPDFKKFPCLKYAYKAAKVGGTAPAALVAADEIAVEYYLKKKIKFSDIPKMIKNVMDNHKNIEKPSLGDILSTIKNTEQEIRKLMAK